jgi:hypothetical protein
MRALFIGWVCLLAGCFNPPMASTTASSTTSSTTATTTGATTAGSTGGTSGTHGSTGSTGTSTTSTGTSGTSSTGTSGTSGTTGSTGTSGCDVHTPCATGVCELTLSACPGPDGFQVSEGGVCRPTRICGSSNGCLGQPCGSNDDCDAYTACLGGTCQGLVCPNTAVRCDPTCTLYNRPHSCLYDCVCDKCPSSNGVCDVGQPCPSGSDCVINATPCPGSPSTASPSLSNGGACVPEPVCLNGDCQDQPCATDNDCTPFQSCLTDHACSYLDCPPLAYTCQDGCTLVNHPHRCAPDCICPTCPVPDAGPACSAATCAAWAQCCGDRCVDTDTDTQNCGSCGHPCGAGEVCMGATCQPASCQSATPCAPTDAGPSTCCGSQCCGQGSICCLVQAGVEYLGCFDAAAGCPLGCPMCL